MFWLIIHNVTKGFFQVIATQERFQPGLKNILYEYYMALFNIFHQFMNLRLLMTSYKNGILESLARIESLESL